MENANKSKKILIVDDEPNILIAIEFLLVKEGYSVQKAFDGHQAMQKVDSFRPDIVILDVMMPGFNGFEVARRIRNIEGNEDVRIIFLTARGTQEDKMTGYSTGGEYYLTKPFDNEELIGIVNELVEFG